MLLLHTIDIDIICSERFSAWLYNEGHIVSNRVNSSTMLINQSYFFNIRNDSVITKNFVFVCVLVLSKSTDFHLIYEFSSSLVPFRYKILTEKKR